MEMAMLWSLNDGGGHGGIMVSSWWGHIAVMVGSWCGHGWVNGHSRVMVGSCRDHVWVIVFSCWGYGGFMLLSWRGMVDSYLGHFVAILGW